MNNMAKKRQYHYIVVFYKMEKDNVAEWDASTYLCSQDETNPAGIPTMGYLIRHAKEDCERRGGKYVDDSLYISNLMKLTKAQYENLVNRDETSEV